MHGPEIVQVGKVKDFFANPDTGLVEMITQSIPAIEDKTIKHTHRAFTQAGVREFVRRHCVSHRKKTSVLRLLSI